MVDTGLALARAYIATGKEEAENLSEKYLNECLVTCQTGYGPQHKKTIEVQDELARLLIRTTTLTITVYKSHVLLIQLNIIIIISWKTWK
jgi:hypothetical protein